MTSAELVAALRVRLDDEVEPYLVPTETVLEQASLTQTEFARLTLVLYDVADAAVTASDPWLTLPDNFFVLKTVVLNGLQLRPVSLSELDFGYYTFNNTENSDRFANWRSASGTPKFVVTDTYPNKVRLVPYPTANATASVEGYVVPPALVLADAGPPEVTAVDPQIPELYHELLIAGTLLRIYTLFDSDTFNATKAGLYQTQWYQGLAEAQNNLRTGLRRQVRLMDLPRGFVFDVGKQTQEVSNVG
jgi:hypothetical protein